MIVGSGVLGHHPRGMIPLFFAWGISGWRLAQASQERVAEPVPARA
jgi:hypothetical protein